MGWFSRKRKRGFHIPGYNYCGPGTHYSGKRPKPINRIDEACQMHDDDPEFDYLRFNKADQRLLDSVTNYEDDDPIASMIIRSVFETKKKLDPVTKRFVPKRRSLQKDLETKEGPEESLLLNDQQGGVVGTRKAMPKFSRSRKRKLYRRSRKYSKRRAVSVYRRSKYSKKGRKASFRRKNGLAKRIARVLNPSANWEQHNAITYVMPSAQRSYWIDPHFYASGTRTTAGDKSHTQFDILSTIHNALFGAATLNEPSEEFWYLGGKEVWTLKNFSNVTQHITVFKLRCQFSDSSNQKPIALMQSDDEPGGVFTGNNSTNVSDATSGVNMLHSTTKLVSIYDYKFLMHKYKPVKKYKIVLQPGEQKKISVMHKAKRILAEWGASSPIIPGMCRILLRVDAEITADGTVTTVAQGAGSLKGAAYGATSLVCDQYNQCRMAKVPYNQRINYISEPTSGVNLNIGTDAKILGPPVDDDGTAMNDSN